MAEQIKPYMIQTLAGTKVKEVNTQEEGESSAAERNDRAESLGIVARYQCVPNPLAA